MNLKSKRILITGGAGFIGSHLVDALPDLNVRVLDDLSTGCLSNLAHHQDCLDFEIVEGDIQNEDLVDDIVQDVDVIFHLACRGVRHSLGHPVASHQVNAFGTLNLLQAAQRHGVKRFIHVSTSEVYGTAQKSPMDESHTCFPETVYGAAKLAGEAYARAYFRTWGLPVVVVRPFNNFGPRSHFEGDSGEVIPRFCVWALNRQQPVIFGDGNQTRDFLYVKDTAAWLRKIAECDEAIGRTINLGSGTEFSVNQIAKLVYRLAGCPDLEPRYLEQRPGDVMRLIADSRLARELVGFQPSTPFEEGVKSLLSCLRLSYSQPELLLDSIEEQNWVDQETVEI